MRILRIAQKLYPETKGGGAYHVHAMSRDQAAMGHDVTVLTVAGEMGLPEHETRDGYDVRRYQPTVSPLGNAVSLGLARQLRGLASAFDVVHAHSHLYFSTNLAGYARWRGSAPLAITNHGLYSQTAPTWLFDAYLKTIGRWTFNAADAVFCYTDTDERRLRERGVATPIDVVANGVDTDRFTPDGPGTDRVDPAGPAILFVGRLVDGKRPGDLVRAFEQICDRVPESTLYLAGDGPLRDDLESLASALGVDERVSFLGHVPYEDMPALYRRADVLCLPSRTEGFPRTVLEALASGTPVVTTDLAQLRGVADECGEMVPHEDMDALASAIVDLCSDDDRRRSLGERGRSIVTDRFAWSDTVAETTSRLATLADGG